MAKKLKKKNSRIIRVDFTGVEKGFKLVDEGDYQAKLIEATPGESDSGNPKIDWVFQITEGKFKGAKMLPFCTSLTPQSLWNLRGLLEAIGAECPEGAEDLDLDDIIENASECSITVEHNTWEGKKRAKIVDLNSLDDSDSSDEADEEEDEEEEETPKKGKSKKASKDEEDEEEDSDEEDETLTEADFKEMKEDELEAIIGEYDLDVELDEDDSIKKKRKIVQEAYFKALEDGEDEADDDEEDEEESEGYSEDDILEMSTKELEAIIKKHKLKVKLDDFSNTRKKRKAVLKALEAAGLLEE